MADTPTQGQKPGSSEGWKPKLTRFFYEWVVTLGLAIAVAFVFRTTLASPRHIPTGSMIPTIKIGEFIFVKMFAYDWHLPIPFIARRPFVHRSDPQRGDIVVFEYPLDADKDFIKRVIGIPGDVVEVRNKRIILNGKPLEITPVTDRHILEDLSPKYNPDDLTLLRENTGGVEHNIMYMNDRAPNDIPEVQVPADSLFVMGDNRDDSYDSRGWGFVARDKVLGQAGFIWFSFDSEHFPWLRFSRFFTMLH